jgi:hypothetical protein
MRSDKPRQDRSHRMDRMIGLAGSRRRWSGSRAPPARSGPARACCRYVAGQPRLIGHPITSQEETSCIPLQSSDRTFETR